MSGNNTGQLQGGGAGVIAAVVAIAVLLVVGLGVLPFAVIAWSAFVTIHSARRTDKAVLRSVAVGVAVVVTVVVYQALGNKFAGRPLPMYGSPTFAADALFLLKITALWTVIGAGLIWCAWGLTGGQWHEVAPYFQRIRDRFSRTRSGALRKDYLRGMGFADLTGTRAPKWLRDGSAKPVALGWVPYPSLESETQHTQIEGGTGTGKSQAIKCLIAEALERGDRLICIDGGGDLFNTFSGVAGAVTRLDVMDPNCAAKWSPMKEIEHPADWAQLATGIIGQGSGDGAEWRAMGRALFSSVGEGYTAACKEAGRTFSNREFYDLLMAAPEDALAPFVQGTPAAALIGNQKGLSSVRMSLLDPLAFFKYLPDTPLEAGFSARGWMRETMKGNGGQRALFLTFKKRDLATTRSLISGLIDLLISTAVDEGKSDKRIWLVIDELAGLGEIPALLMGAAELRKTGVRLVVGMQDYDQIEHIYGRARAASITNNLSNKLVLGTNDPNASERLSKMLGEQKVLVHGRSENQSKGFFSGPGTEGTSQTERDERLVMASEIQGLPRLVGFCKMAGSDTVHKTPVPVFGGFAPNATETPGLPSPALVALPR